MNETHTMQNSENISKKSNFLSVNELMKSEFTPPGWIWNGLIPDKGLTFFCGRPGTKKSLIMQALILHIVSGKSFLDHETKKCSVIILDSENTLSELATRFQTLDAKINTESESCNAFIWLDSEVTLTPIGLKDLHTKIKELNPELIVFDSFIRFFQNLDENSSKDVRIVFQSLRPILKERAVLILHHAIKGKGRVDSQSLRGSGDLFASASSTLVINEGPNGLVEITQEKNRQGSFEKSMKIITKQEEIEGKKSTEFIRVNDDRISQTAEILVTKWIDDNVDENSTFKSGEVYNNLTQFSQTELRETLSILLNKGKITYVSKGKWLRLS